MTTKFEFEFRYNFERLCKETVTMTQVKKIIRAIKSPDFIHARYVAWCGGSIYIYHRCAISPSGKILAASHRDEVVSFLLTRYSRAAALSPTEGF